ncbi:unnamed protein product [Sphagnum jensenii]|uniref:Uncharacterized protein n=1 Tax=Sphagnum jensenii TaxID=128206 RepID=A0ABP1A6E5_9BRYO
MATDTGAMAWKGFGKMMTASKSGMAVLSSGLSKMKKSYATKHEADVVSGLKNKGVHPRELLFAAMQRLDYLSLAGYNSEITAVSQQAAKRLTDVEKSSVPLDAVIVLGGAMSEESMKYGDFQKGSILQGLQEYMNMSKMGKDHYDRDSLVHDFYYAILICSEEYGGNWQEFERMCRELVGQVVKIGYETSGQYSDTQLKAAKSIFTFASAIKLAAQQEEQKQQKSLREAEALIQREQEKRRPLSTTSMQIKQQSIRET